jgi:hypothetical protein
MEPHLCGDMDMCWFRINDLSQNTIACVKLAIYLNGTICSELGGTD